uniref:Uncharacterized protein n=1 Tax=Heterorhabditis bacteriophora TaxID=37862 RepID=A0A1I7W908_HETBA
MADKTNALVPAVLFGVHHL